MNSKRMYSRQLPHPVTLISVSDGKRENIATMAWVSSVSLDPPLLMVAVKPKRFTHDLVLAAGEFALIVLASHQKELSTLAGTQSGNKVKKWELEIFRQLRKEPGLIRSPLLRDCRAAYECRLASHYAAGDHTIFVGEILQAEINPDAKPLILFDRRYFSIGEFIAKYP